MFCHHNLEKYIEAYLKGAGFAADAKGFLFRTASGRTGQLSDRPMTQPDVYRMIIRRTEDADARTKVCCHSFRATWITEYLRNGGKLEVANKWPITNQPALQASMTAGMIRFPSMRSNGS